MKFVLLVYLEQKFATAPKEEQERIHRECTAWHDDLVNRGKSSGATGLQPASAGKTLRDRAGKVAITDGPYAETKEVLGGFESLECADLEEAVAIARAFPGLRGGCSVEVRPVVPGNKC
jgi:hypothetical protein